MIAMIYQGLLFFLKQFRSFSVANVLDVSMLN
ncbi:Uncharacterised protein [Ewingella americana]|uniref:Uncharacterized protein n=1 Tax=Ewingella americana TaxID=41202 RepID=A0A377NCC5_9GAMM|nr:Uncharacterised protein [Ewingella americana]